MSEIENYPNKLSDGYYYVRTDWNDEETQAGRYKTLKSAITKCDKTPDSHVFTEEGVAIYPEESKEEAEPETKEETKDEARDEAKDEKPKDEKDTEINAKPASFLYGRVTTLLNVRSDTSLSGEKIGQLKRGSLVEILEDCGYDWYRIKFDTDCGYAYVCHADNKFVQTGSELYTVSPTDTIRKIAEKTLGDEKRADEIKELNGLTSNALKVGMTLLIP